MKNSGSACVMQLLSMRLIGDPTLNFEKMEQVVSKSNFEYYHFSSS